MHEFKRIEKNCSDKDRKKERISEVRVETLSTDDLERLIDEGSDELKKRLSSPAAQGRGYARKILEEMFRLPKEHQWTLVSSGYSMEGKEKLENIDRELAEKYQVTFFNESEWGVRSIRNLEWRFRLHRSHGAMSDSVWRSKCC